MQTSYAIGIKYCLYIWRQHKITTGVGPLAVLNSTCAPNTTECSAQRRQDTHKNMLLVRWFIVIFLAHGKGYS